LGKLGRSPESANPKNQQGRIKFAKPDSKRIKKGHWPNYISHRIKAKPGEKEGMKTDLERKKNDRVQVDGNKKGGQARAPPRKN